MSLFLEILRCQYDKHMVESTCGIGEKSCLNQEMIPFDL